MKPFSSRYKAAEIAIIYLLLGVMWILFSDFFLLQFFSQEQAAADISLLQTFKGWAYVLLTAAVLYWLTYRAFKSQTAALHRLSETEVELLESRAQISHLLADSPTVLYALAPKGVDGKDKFTSLWVSESITRILGYSPEEALEDNWWLNNLHPDDRIQAIKVSQKLSSGESVDHSYRFFSKNREIFWMRDTARAVLDEHGKTVEIIGSWINVTAEQAEEERRRLYSAAFESITEAVLVMDLQRQIISANRAVFDIFGYTEVEIIGRKPNILNSGRHDHYFFNSMHTHLEKSGVWRGEIWNRCKNGEINPQWLSICVVRNTDGHPEKYVAVYTDISELKKTERKLQHLAHHDSLTDLPNRNFLLTRLKLGLQQAARLKSKIALLYIDLDDFKSVNDSMGHTIGDELLIAVSARLSKRVRGEDTLARVGGDEFLLLTGYIDTSDAAAVIAGAMLDILKEPFILSNNNPVYVEACIGISIYPDDGTTAEALLRNADTAMYRAKQSGRNRFWFYEVEMSNRVVEQLQIETELRQSIPGNELMLHYQPKLDLRSGRITGAEALVRWTHPTMGMIAPGKFIPIAEKSGLIISLGDWVIRESCRQIREWLDNGYEPLNIAINISLKQFVAREQELIDLIRSTLEEFFIPPHYLSLEITESTLMDDSGLVRNSLNEMKSLGCSIALDDFGTGFSNLAYLSQLPLDILKIDISFIRNIGNSSQADNLIHAVIDLAHGIGLRTIAEGVETEEQKQLLLKHGCDELQGFLFSKPLPAEDYLALLQAEKAVKTGIPATP